MSLVTYLQNDIILANRFAPDKYSVNTAIAVLTNLGI